jgi:hypothetical protein
MTGMLGPFDYLLGNGIVALDRKGCRHDFAIFCATGVLDAALASSTLLEKPTSLHVISVS